MGTIAKAAAAIGLVGAGTYFMVSGNKAPGTALTRQASGGAPGTLAAPEEAKQPPKKKTIVRRHSSGLQCPTSRPLL